MIDLLKQCCWIAGKNIDSKPIESANTALNFWL